MARRWLSGGYEGYGGNITASYPNQAGPGYNAFWTVEINFRAA